jgi:enoyl-CoA hydratase/carnithine racemase
VSGASERRGEVVRIERRDAVALVTIDRPERRNALDGAVRHGLARAVADLERDGTTRVVVIRGAGSRAFASGGDIAEMAEMDSDAARRHFVEFEACLGAIERSRLPFLAMIRGFALGGGCELACSCDLRIAASDGRFGVPIGRLGHTLDLANARRLLRLVGPARIKAMLWTDQLIDAGEAHRIGLVDWVVPAPQLEDFTFSLARTIAAKAPRSIAGTKEVLDYLAQHPAPAPDEDNARFAAPLFDSDDFKEGVRAFLDKRAPRFTGR